MLERSDGLSWTPQVLNVQAIHGDFQKLSEAFLENLDQFGFESPRRGYDVVEAIQAMRAKKGKCLSL